MTTKPRSSIGRLLVAGRPRGPRNIARLSIADLSELLRVKLGVFRMRTQKHLERPIALALNRGGYFCPLCSRKFPFLIRWGIPSTVNKKYDIVGARPRRHQCPKCDMTDRERLIYLFFSRHEEWFTDRSTIVHVAPEKHLSEFLAALPSVNYITGDLHPEAYSWRRMERLDLQDIQIPSETVDLFVCNHVLEHVQDDTKALAEVHRVLKKGGRAILQVPYSNILSETVEDSDTVGSSDRLSRLRRFGQGDHVRIYSRAGIVGRFRAAGFEVVLFSPDRVAKRPDIYRTLNRTEELFLCNKPS